MNILGVGTSELFFILLIMLIVAGPKRMIAWAYVAGQYAAKLRVMWAQTMEALQQEMDEAGVDVQLPKDLPTRGSINRMTGDIMRPFTEPIDDARKSGDAEIRRLNTLMRKTAEEARTKASLRDDTPQSAPSADMQAPQQSKDTPVTDFGTWSGKTTEQDTV